MRTLLLTLCFVLTACSPSIFEESNCSNQLISSTASANGQFVASLIRRDCGATAAYSNLVFLKRSGDTTGKDGPWGENIYVSQGEMPIALEWYGSELRIEAPTMGKDVFLKRDNWTDVRIVYK
ncbi:hypothetical protein C2I33_24935 [Ralstonia solanacearum]|nr:hypothetical protein C2I33_24935 [Ralstonia solanacearum]